MKKTLTLTILGTPTGQGSMRAQLINGRATMRHSQPNKIAEFRAHVHHYAQTHFTNEKPLTGPITIYITALYQRPKTHYLTSGQIKTNAPQHPTTRFNSDIDKTCRLVLDALTQTQLIIDDSHVTQLEAEKRFAQPGEQPGYQITIIGEQTND